MTFNTMWNRCAYFPMRRYGDEHTRTVGSFCRIYLYNMDHSPMKMKVLQVHFMKIWTIKMDIVHFSSSPTVWRYIILEFPVPNRLNTNFRVFIQISQLIIDISPILAPKLVTWYRSRRSIFENLKIWTS